jgi:hypothetical protein
MRMTIDEDMVRIVDALFIEMAERAGSGLSADDSWDLFELGLIRIITSDGPMSVEPCAGRNRAERLAQAQKNRPLVELKRQMDRARETAS